MRNSKKIISLLIILTMLFSMFTAVNAAALTDYTNNAIKVNSINGISDDFIMGADVSMLKDIEYYGGKFYNDAGVEQDCLQILKDHGVNWVRLRIWNDPTTDANGVVGGDKIVGAIAGTPAGAGTCDEATVIALAVRAKAMGMKVLLDFHYSDFWADPAKQVKPKAWKDLTGSALQDAVYTFTKTMLTDMNAKGAMPEMVQIGNETNSGMLFPEGNIVNGFAGWIGLINAAAKAVREVETAAGSDTKIMLHLANGGDNKMYRKIYDKFTDVSKATDYNPLTDTYSSSLVDYNGVTAANGATTKAVDFDVIGLSYYAFWHGPLNQFKANIENLAASYDKKIAIAEVGYGYTFENGDSQSNAFGPDSEMLGGYQASIQGQAQYIRDIMDAVSQLRDKNGNKSGLGIFYWEPEWIPVLDDTGNTLVGWITGGGDDSENRALFDFAGKALPSLDVFKDVKKTNVSYTASIIKLRPASAEAVVAQTPTLPATVKADYSDGTIREVAVTWDNIQASELEKLHTFTVNGSVAGTDIKATVSVNVIGLKNYITNYGFEAGNLSGWKVTTYGDKVEAYVDSNNPYKGTYSFHYYFGAAADSGYTIEKTITGLPNGNYTLKAVSQGEEIGTVNHKMFVKEYGGAEKTCDIVNTAWHEWKFPEIKNIQVTNGQCTIGVKMDVNSAGAWGNLDDFVLYPDLSAAELSIPAATASGSNFNVNFSYKGLIYNVYAQDISIHYDSGKMNFVSAAAADINTAILSTKNDSTLGTVRILAANTAAGGASWNAAAMNFTFAAKTSDIASSDITITKADLGTADGSIINPNALLTSTLINALAPTITAQPASKTVYVNGAAQLTVTAAGTGILSYQWYSNTQNSTSGATAITGATGTALQVPTSQAGTKYYYCVVTNTDNSMTGEKTATTTSEIAAVTVNAITNSGTTGSTSGSTSSPTSTSSAEPSSTTVEVKVGADGKATIAQKPLLDSASGTAAVAMSSDKMKNALAQVKANANGIKEITLQMPKVEGAKAYSQQLPKETLSSDKLDKQIDIVTPLGAIKVSGNMLQSIKLDGIENVSLKIGIADTSALSSEAKSQIGNRPVIDLNLQAGGKTISWSNPAAPVTVAVPYTPTADELKKPELITVYYIDGSGKLVPVTNAKYDALSGKVVFTTTHFSKYAVAFVNKTFTDVKAGQWFANPVEILASKGIVTGTSESTFSPDVKITRGDFVEWLVNTLGLEAKYDINFSDISKTASYCNAVGIAKALAITSGTGNDKFTPDKEISRQDMMVMTIKALKVADIDLAAGSSSDISKFVDASKISKYAVANVETMVKAGLISGSGNKVNPTNAITRAETAQVLYKIFVKYV